MDLERTSDVIILDVVEKAVYVRARLADVAIEIRYWWIAIVTVQVIFFWHGWPSIYCNSKFIMRGRNVGVHTREASKYSSTL